MLIIEIVIIVHSMSEGADHVFQLCVYPTGIYGRSNVGI